MPLSTMPLESGTAAYNNVGKVNMTILFTRDPSIENNTAITKSITTDSNGNYTLELTPGTYNVSVEELVNESGVNVTYTAKDHITLVSSEGSRVLNIVLTREQEL